MDVTDLLVTLAKAKFDVSVVGCRLRVCPPERLTDDLRAAIREHKDRLLAARCEVCGAHAGGYGLCTRHDPFRAEVTRPCA